MVSSGIFKWRLKDSKLSHSPSRAKKSLSFIYFHTKVEIQIELVTKTCLPPSVLVGSATVPDRSRVDGVTSEEEATALLVPEVDVEPE